jgi:hypothetical protein
MALPETLWYLRDIAKTLFSAETIAPLKSRILPAHSAIGHAVFARVPFEVARDVTLSEGLVPWPVPYLFKTVQVSVAERLSAASEMKVRARKHFTR